MLLISSERRKTRLSLDNPCCLHQISLQHCWLLTPSCCENIGCKAASYSLGGFYSRQQAQPKSFLQLTAWASKAMWLNSIINEFGISGTFLLTFREFQLRQFQSGSSDIPPPPNSVLACPVKWLWLDWQLFVVFLFLKQFFMKDMLLIVHGRIAGRA